MKYAYQQLCTITSTLEISYWMMSSIHNSRIVDLQISPHLLQFHRYIYIHVYVNIKMPQSVMMVCTCVL